MTDTGDIEWYVPAAVTPDELQGSLEVIRKYLATPFNLEGKKASSLLRKKTTRRRRRKASPSTESDNEPDDKMTARKEKRQKEKQEYKSAAMIMDSDEEYGDMDAFLEKEKALREKTARLTMEGGNLPTMKKTGTKKRRMKASEQSGSKRRKKHDSVAALGSEDEASAVEGSSSDDKTGMTLETSPQLFAEPKSRPKPRARFGGPVPGASSATVDLSDAEPEDSDEDGDDQPVARKTKKLVVTSDNE